MSSQQIAGLEATLLVMAKILVVEDDPEHGDMICSVLKRDGYTVDRAESGSHAKAFLLQSPYDAVLIDWILPDISGIELLSWLRGFKSTPVMVVTGKGKIDDRVEGLDTGADDYLIKPFSSRELSARVRALLRRPPVVRGGTLRAGDFELDSRAMTVKVRDREFRMRRREFMVFECLARHPEEIFSSEALLVRVWSTESESTVESVRTTVREIRKVLGEHAIETIPRVGYKLGHG